MTLEQNQQLEHYESSLGTKLDIYLDEEVADPYYYRNVIQRIGELSENDQIHWHIASGGGDLSGLEVLLTANERTPALSIALIEGECHSAASMFAMSCHGFVVSDNASMLVHYVKYNDPSVEAVNHKKKAHDFLEKRCEKLFRRLYTHFLSEHEIIKCIEDDYQLWLSAEDIQERLTLRQEMLMRELEEKQKEEYEELHAEEPESNFLGKVKNKLFH